jgi:site-specific DNA recombinase
MMQVFEKHGVAFVSVTQAFNTANSMGRLILNVLLSFAQFEREIISERTRDKVAATRRKGKWAGGHPILGYDVDPKALKLTVNVHEAERVRAIFQMYLKHESLLPVVEDLAQRGWTNKRWVTRKGPERGGKAFTRTSVFKLLTNVLYIGKVRYKHEIHNGEHVAIVEPTVWQRTQAVLERNGRTGGAPVRNQFGAFLKGLIRCAPCACSMTPTHTTRDSNKRYRYYVCSSAQKRGWKTCPTKAVPAQQIEALVLKQIQAIGNDPDLLAEVLKQVRAQEQEKADAIAGEQQSPKKDLGHWHKELWDLTARLKPGEDSGPAMARLADLQERITAAEGAMRNLENRAQSLQHSKQFDPGDAALALSAFDPVWATLAPREQARIIELLIERVDFDGAKGKVAIAFRESAIQTLANRPTSSQCGRTP